MTAVTEAVIQILVAEAPVLRADSRVLLTGPEGEWHMLPGRMVALVLRQLGWDVFQLTPGLPPEDLAALARAEPGHVAGISCSLPGNLIPAWQAISALRQAGFNVLAGGRAFDSYPGVAQVLGADRQERDPLRAHELLRDWAARPGPGPRPATLQRQWAPVASTWAAIERVVTDAAVLAADMEGVAMPGDVLRQDLTLMLMTAAAAALVGRHEILADHVAWYEELLPAAGRDPDPGPALLRSLGRVLPADADPVRDVLGAVLAATRS